MISIFCVSLQKLEFLIIRLVYNTSYFASHHFHLSLHKKHLSSCHYPRSTFFPLIITEDAHTLQLSLPMIHLPSTYQYPRNISVSLIITQEALYLYQSSPKEDLLHTYHYPGNTSPPHIIFTKNVSPPAPAITLE